MFGRLRTLWRLGDAEIIDQLTDLQKHIEQLRHDVKNHTASINITGELFDGLSAGLGVLTTRLDTLSARINVLQPREKDMVPCPVCKSAGYEESDEGNWRDEPPHQVSCRCCEGQRRIPKAWADYAEMMEEQVATLVARQLGSERKADMVPCPACTEGLVFTAGNADDPPSHDRCELCGGAAEVREGVAAYVGKLQWETRRWEGEAYAGRAASKYWKSEYDKAVAQCEEEARLRRPATSEEKALNG